MEPIPQQSDEMEVSEEEGIRLTAEYEAAAKVRDSGYDEFEQQLKTHARKERTKHNPRKQFICPECGWEVFSPCSSVKKQCSYCKKLLSITLFFKDGRSISGLRSECKQCGKDKRSKYRSGRSRLIWAQGVLSSRRQRGYTIKITPSELEKLAEGLSVCSCGQQLTWIQGDLCCVSHRSKFSPHLVTISKIITLGSVSIQCKNCAERAWKSIALAEKEIPDRKPELTEQPDVGGVKVMKMEFFQENSDDRAE